MAGLKTFWITISALFLLGACVPQTKQTECGANEAFNASLRTCVPIVGGPSSFINVASFAPVSSITKHNNDFSTMTFEITISNPYNQSYTITWERIYNANTNTMCSNALTCSFPASLLSSELGTHVLVAKIKDGNGTTVDSHNFEIRIVDELKPVINSATLNPTLTTPGPYTPNDPRIQFSFTASNNGATFSALNNYRTVWTVEKNGSVVHTESDTFTNFATTGSNISYLGNSPTPYFNPATQGVGNYIIRAKVQNDVPGEVVAEQMWSFTIAHPTLSPVISRNLYEASGSPAFTTTVNAYNGVAYNSSTLYNFIPAGSAAQANFCVEVQDGEGVYSGDGNYVRVDYYLDGVTLIYSNSTTAIDKKVCLSDAAAAVLSTIIFTNTTTTSSQPHTLVARVVDEFLGTEYTTADMFPSLGTYPVTWNLDVKPQNAAPTVAFGATSTISCSFTSSTTKSGCVAPSDTDFTVGINFSSDDFYTIAANEPNLDYSFRLYMNGSIIQECNKSDAGADGTTDVAGAEYTCVFNIPSYDATGPIDITAQTFQIRAEISDDSSPITAVGATSRTLVWNLSATETNTAPAISSFTSNSPVSEGAVLSFAVGVDDVQRDNFTYQIQYCNDDAVADAACASSTILTSGTIVRTSNALTNTVNVNYSLPQDFLLNLPLIPCDTTARNATCTVRFRAVITDIPNTAAPLTTTSATTNVVITNINPLPVFNDLIASPAPSATNGTAFVGIPFTFSASGAGVITDASTAAAERTFRYQWYAKNSNSVTTYAAIDGATSASLVWTPSLIKESDVALDEDINVILCVEDQPSTIVGTPNETDSVCNTANPWTLIVQNNVATLETLTDPLAKDSGDSVTEMAVWYDIPSTFNSVSTTAVYVASVDNNRNVHVKRALVDNTGEIIPDANDLLASFQALPGAAAGFVKDLSITGTSGNSLYVAYLASSSLAPFTYYPQVRRIDISNEKIVPNNHEGKLGFDYDGIDIDDSGVTRVSGNAADLVITNNKDGNAPTVLFNPTGDITGTLVIVTPVGSHNITFAAFPNAAGTICSNCSGTTMAANLESILNRDYTNLMGLSAPVGGSNSVTINGSLAMDYLDLSGTVTQGFTRTADQLGNIYVVGTNFYLPFIDNSLGGSYNDKISLLSGTIDVNMDIASGAAIIDPISNLDLNNLPASSRISTYHDGASLYIGLVTKVGSAGRLYVVDSDDFSPIGNTNVMVGEVLSDIEIAASSSRVFVKANTMTDIKLGAYTTAPVLIAGSEFLISDIANVNVTTSSIFNVTDLSSSRIVAYGDEARVLGISQGVTAGEYRLYMAKYNTSGTWTLDCMDCDRISPFDQFVSPYVKIGVAPIRAKVAADALYRLASAGATTNQNIKDVLFTGFALMDDSAAPTISNPNLGIFNMENELISADDLFVGPALNEDAGLYRGPFLKN